MKKDHPFGWSLLYYWIPLTSSGLSFGGSGMTDGISTLLSSPSFGGGGGGG